MRNKIQQYDSQITGSSKTNKENVSYVVFTELSNIPLKKLQADCFKAYQSNQIKDSEKFTMMGSITVFCVIPVFICESSTSNRTTKLLYFL